MLQATLSCIIKFDKACPISEPPLATIAAASVPLKLLFGDRAAWWREMVFGACTTPLCNVCEFGGARIFSGEPLLAGLLKRRTLGKR